MPRSRDVRTSWQGMYRSEDFDEDTPVPLREKNSEFMMEGCRHILLSGSRCAKPVSKGSYCERHRP